MDYKIFKFKNVEQEEFIKFWRQFYEVKDQEKRRAFRVNYFKFVNEDKKLTKDDIYLSMTWKKGWYDPEKTYTVFGSWDCSVSNIIKNLNYINNIKTGKEKKNLEEFINWLTDMEIFPNTIRMKSYVCHLIKPMEWPILDRFVWVAYKYIKEEDLGPYAIDSVNDYLQYLDFFNNLASGRTTITERKEIDEALTGYGHFISNHKEQIIKGIL